MTFPDRLTNAAPPQLRAWQARAPLLTPLQRIDSARIATGLGVFSSQALLDLYSAIYDSTDPDDLPESDAWQVRLAFVGRDQEARLAAMRRLWSAADGRIQRKAAWALLSRAASLVPPSVELQEDAANLIASMLAGGRDREAARWAAAVRRFDDRAADQSWAMLATGVPDPRQVELTVGRVNAFIGRDDSRGRTRSAFLVAGLAGLGRLDLGAADRLNRRYGLGLDHRTRYTRMLDSAAARGQAGTVLVMSGTGLQSFGTETLSPAHLFHIVAALRKTNQDFMARMIAAEALAAT